MNQVEQSIIKAFLYADIFDFPLTSEEVFARYQAKRSVLPEKISQSLSSLVSQKIIFTNGTYYFLPGRNHLVLKRKQRLKSSTDKYIATHPLIQQLSRLPGVRAVFLTGTVAADNAESSDDIDIMVVSARNKLWTSRLFTTAALEIKGVRRKPLDQNPDNKICANLYLEETHLAVPENNRNLYTAHEVILAKPVADEYQIGQHFIKANQWVRHYLPNTLIPTIKKSAKINHSAIKPSTIETIARQLQFFYMKNKITRETITPHTAYFHPQDTGTIILNKFNKSLSQYDLQP